MIKRRSVALLRHQIEPVSPAALAAFLPRWQCIGPRATTRLRGVEGVLEAVRMIAGVPVPVSVLETAILPTRVGDYRPAMLDELTSSGEVRWTGTAALPGGDSWVALAPATEEHLLPRSAVPDDVAMAPELLGMLRQGGGWFLADLVARLEQDADSAGRVAEALRALLWAGLVSNDTLEPVRSARDRARAARGPAAGRASARLGRPPRGRYADLWRPGAGLGVRGSPGTPGSAVWAGSAGTPGSAGLDRTRGRGTMGPGAGAGTGAGAATDAGTARPPRRWMDDLPGRWYALAVEEPDPAVLALTTAQAHLERLGLVTRGAVAAAGDPGGFAAAYRTLAAMEERGRVQRVYAVDGLGAAQFALPGVVDQLRDVERELADGPGEVLVLASADPANAYGAALEWPSSDWSAGSGGPHRPKRAAGSHVVLRGGRPALYVERGGHSLLTFRASATLGDEPPDAHLADAARALVGAVHGGQVPPLDVTRVNGVPALSQDEEVRSVVAVLTEAGFTPTPKGLRVRR